MKDPSAAMQAAIYSKLTASSGLATAMGGAVRAYDKIPAAPVYPYIRIGDDQALDGGRSNSCSDGWDFVVTLHIFSRHANAPRMEAKAIANQALQAIGTLATPPAPAGYLVKEIEFGQSRAYFEADGLTAHGIASVTYLLREA